MTGPILPSVPLVRVRWVRTTNNVTMATDPVTVTATVNYLTVPGDDGGHGFIDLATVTSTSSGNIDYVDLVPTDDADVVEDFGWTFTFVNSTRPARTVSVPQTGQLVTTTKVNGVDTPTVWLDDLADFTGASGPTGNQYAPFSYVDDSITALQAAEDPFPQYELASDAGTTGAVTSVAGRTGAVTLSKTDVGLGNVDNTADTAKPVSTAQQTALNAKANTSSLAAVATSGSASDITTGTLPDGVIPAGIARDSEVTTAIQNVVGTAPANLDTLQEIAAQLNNDESAASALTTAVAGKQPLDSDLTAIAALDSTTSGAIGSDGSGWVKKTYAQLKTALGLTKTDVGLGNVDNTSDIAKPISTAQQTALDAKPPATRAVTAGTGLTGGGDLTADRSFAVAYGTSATTAAVGNDSRITGAAQKSANLSDLASASTARTNLGLGPLATETPTGTASSTTFLRGDGAWATPAGGGSGAVNSVNGYTGTVVLAAADVGATRLSVDGTYASTYDLDTTPVTPSDIGAQPVDTDLTAIAALDSSTSGAIASDGAGWIKKTYAQLKTALSLVKADVGLGNVDNTADTAKPVSTAQQTALDAKAPTSRALTAGTGLTGGGDLTLDRSFAVSYGTTAGTAAQGNDSRITGAVQSTRNVTAGTGLTGGGALSADVTLAVAYGTTGTTAAAGNDSRITGAVQNTRQVLAGTGLTGGGALSADQTLAVAYGTTSTTAAVGNDGRFTQVTANTQTASYTLALTDAGKAVEMNVASANTLTVPPNSSVAFPVGTVIEVAQYGAGQTTITAGAGVTIRNPSSLTTRAQYSSVALRKRAADEWMLSGDLT